MYLLAAAVLVVAAVGMALAVRHHRSMCTALLALQAENQADTVFKSDSAALRLVRHFDSPACLLGTSNDRMLAHYLLGRAHADMGEAPAAIQDYYDAIECADTTDADCSFYLLCRIYGQMADLFYEQGLYNESIECCDASTRFAWRANELYCAIVGQERKLLSYEMLGKTDSIPQITQWVYQKYKEMGEENFASISLWTYMNVLVNEEDYDKASVLIREYETKSSLFDSLGNISEGREIFYFLKGTMLLGQHKMDSAEIYFRKELSCSDHNNKNVAALGLANLYDSLGFPDSVAKYAMLSRLYNDSSILLNVSMASKRIQSHYNYSRQEKIAQENEAIAFRRAIWIVILITCIIFIVIIGIITERKQEFERNSLKRMLLDMQNDVLCLSDENKELSTIIIEKQGKIRALGEQIVQTQKRHSIGDINTLIFTSDVNTQLKKHLQHATLPPTQVWQQLYQTINEYIPTFYSSLLDVLGPLTESEYRLCILVRMNFRLSDIAVLIGSYKQQITNMKRRLLSRMMHTDVKGLHSADFDSFVQQIV